MKKTLITIALTVLACLCVVGTTLAFLVDKTDPIENTFTVGNVDIELTETTGNTYKLIPGHVYDKDPTITVANGSETCWLFVKAESVNNVSDYVTYEIAAGWTKLNVSGADGVYYREVKDNDAEREFSVLEGDKITVISTLTSADLARAKDKVPTLTFTAYAVQKDGLTVEEAWAQATNTANYPAETTTATTP